MLHSQRGERDISDGIIIHLLAPITILQSSVQPEQGNQGKQGYQGDQANHCN